MEDRVVRTECRRHLRHLERGHPRGHQWYADLAELNVQFAIGSVDEPLSLPLSWKAFIIGSRLGWAHPKKKNAKYLDILSIEYAADLLCR